MKLASKIFRSDKWYVTSPFGYRKPIKTNAGITSSFHNGCDYGTSGQKWAQYAIEEGYILNCGVANDGAKYIWVNYPRIGIKLLHYHLDSICIKSGQNVKEGTLLGYTGQTGMATGIHLHLGMKKSNGGNYLDPHSYDYQENKMNFHNSIENTSELVDEIIAGKWGNGAERIKLLTDAGYDAKKIQEEVNKAINNNYKNSETKYVVQKGDTLSSIAEIYNTTYQKIYQKNKNIIGDNPDIIKPGQILYIDL